MGIIISAAAIVRRSCALYFIAFTVRAGGRRGSASAPLQPRATLPKPENSEILESDKTVIQRMWVALNAPDRMY